MHVSSFHRLCSTSGELISTWLVSEISVWSPWGQWTQLIRFAYVCRRVEPNCHLMHCPNWIWYSVRYAAVSHCMHPALCICVCMYLCVCSCTGDCCKVVLFRVLWFTSSMNDYFVLYCYPMSHINFYQSSLYCLHCLTSYTPQRFSALLPLPPTSLNDSTDDKFIIILFFLIKRAQCLFMILPLLCTYPGEEGMTHPAYELGSMPGYLTAISALLLLPILY